MKISSSYHLLFTFILLMASLILKAEVKMAYGVIMDEGSNKKIIEVYKGSPAEKAGLKAGDLILTVRNNTTDGMDNVTIAATLSKQDDVALTVSRDGAKLMMEMRRRPLYAFESKCLTGDCENGKGRMKFPKWDNNEVEGNFKQGDIVGEASLFLPDGTLWYKGLLSHFRPDGIGKKYKKDGSGKIYLAESGRYRNWVLDYGSVYNEAGEELSNGLRKGDSTIRLIGGSMQIMYRGKKAYQFCEDMLGTDKDGNSECQGWATIREDNPVSGKMLAYTYYTLGKRDSICFEWDHANDAYHVIEYRKGVIKEAAIARISDKKMIASGVQYATAYENSGDLINHILIGSFMFGSRTKYNTSSGEGSNLEYFKSKYVDKDDPNPFAHLEKDISMQRNNDQQEKRVEKSKYDATTVYVCKMKLDNIKDDAMRAARYYNTAISEEKGYKAHRYNYEQLQNEIISNCDKAIREYKDSVPKDLIDDIKEIRRLLDNHNLVPGFMRSIPTLMVPVK